MKQILLSLLVFVLLATTNSCTKKQPTTLANENKEIEWMSITEAEKAAKKKPKKIMIDVYTDWCGWCKRMDASTFKNPVVANYVNKNYYAVKLNAERADSILFRGKNYRLKGSANELAVELLGGRMSYPTIVLLDEQQQLIQALPGFQDAAKFDMVLNYFGQDNHKKNISFADFATLYKSSLQ